MVEVNNMYAKGKGSTAPSDGQAREKLALYVYEYLLHSGAAKSAQTFLNEIRWEKNISLGEPPGFLLSWWSVFWDLYCASPERRDNSDHSSEAKAFHDYGFINSGYSVNGMPPHPGQPILPTGMDPNRPPCPPGGLGPRMTPPRGHMGPGPMVPYGPLRGPPPSGGPLPPMGGRPPWAPGPGSCVMSPGGGYPGPGGGPPPHSGEPGPNPGDGMYNMMKTPTGGSMQGDMCPTSDSSMGGSGPGSNGGAGGGGANSSGGGGPPSAGGNGGPGSGPGGSNGSGAPPPPSQQQQPQPPPMENLNDNIKTSPSNGPGTPREESGGSMNEYMPPYGNNGENDQNESAAILKIKESMQEEAKRFEKDSEHQDYYMP